MLDLQKLMGQMQGMSEQLQREAQQLTANRQVYDRICSAKLVSNGAIALVLMRLSLWKGWSNYKRSRRSRNPI